MRLTHGNCGVRAGGLSGPIHLFEGMDMDVRKKVAAGIVAAAAVGVGSFFAFNAAGAAHSIQATAQNPVFWLCHNNSNGTNTGVHRYDGSGSYPGCGSGYAIWYWSQQGPAGTNGSNGTDATLTVTATTQATDRQDTTRNGNTWAVDQLTRTITVTRDHEVSASKCGTAAASCWHYFGTITDTGTFRSVDGAKSPEGNKPISGTVQGSINGNSGIEFYASSNTPDTSLVPATLSGNDVSTSDWAKQLFPTDTAYTGATQPSFSYTYSAANTCEQWTEASTGDTGDIQGVNHCG